LGRPAIGEDELRFTYSRASGPGGQHVNRVETRVTLLFDVADSPSLTDEQKRRVRRRLATRINKEGVLRVVSQRHRTREANRRAAIERFEELLAEALRSPRPRRKTRVPEGAKRRRIESKRRRGDVKRLRGRPDSSDD
jgi:ribosome-associated protein